MTFCLTSYSAVEIYIKQEFVIKSDMLLRAAGGSPSHRVRYRWITVKECVDYYSEQSSGACWSYSANYAPTIITATKNLTLASHLFGRLYRRSLESIIDP
jgi:hypothetical protein